MTEDKDDTARAEKWLRPLGLAADDKTMNVFPTLEQAHEYIRKRKTIIVVDKDGNEKEMPFPGLDEK